MSKITTDRYSPNAWQVSEERAGVYTAQNTVDGSSLRVFAYSNGEFRTWGEDRESIHNVDQMLACDCGDFEHRALPAGRLCRHGSACCAVEGFVAIGSREEQHQPTAAERKAIARADIESLGL
jgi:hypothetical protein